MKRAQLAVFKPTTLKMKKKFPVTRATVIRFSILSLSFSNWKKLRWDRDSNPGPHQSVYLSSNLAAECFSSSQRTSKRWENCFDKNWIFWKKKKSICWDFVRKITRYHQNLPTTTSGDNLVSVEAKLTSVNLSSIFYGWIRTHELSMFGYWTYDLGHRIAKYKST